jgi:hypothetical protein
LFALRQNFEAFQFHQKQVTQCDQAIEAQIRRLAETRQPPAQELPAQRPRCKPSKNEPRVELRALLHRITGGTDLSQIDGIGPYGALQLIAEIGTDMSRWPTEKHFTGSLTLAPNNKISGKRLPSSRTQPSANRAAAVLRRAAMSLTRSATALGACYRRLAYRLGLRPLPPLPANSPYWSTLSCAPTSPTAILVPVPICSSTVPASSTA